MRYSVFIIILVVLFNSCDNHDAMQRGSRREILIAELKNLRTVLESGDKNDIAEIFSFPLADTVFSPYVDDSSYQEEYKQTGNKVTEALFLKYFKEISADLHFDKLLHYINLDSLLVTDEVNHEIRSDKQPCYKFYGVSIENNDINLDSGSNTNEDYSDPDKKNEEDEGVDGGCEFGWSWLFRFDGVKLHFIRMTFAG